MPLIKRPNRAIVAAFGVIIAVVAFAVPAVASPYTPRTTCSVSDETPSEGGHFTLRGRGYGAHERVRNVLHSVPYTLAPAVSDASGNFAVSVALPMGYTGNHTITATGTTTGFASTVAITIGGTSTTAAAPASGSLAFTGAAIAGLGLLAVLFLVGGGLLLFASRRRKVNV